MMTEFCKTECLSRGSPECQLPSLAERAANGARVVLRGALELAATAGWDYDEQRFRPEWGLAQALASRQEMTDRVNECADVQASAQSTEAVLPD